MHSSLTTIYPVDEELDRVVSFGMYFVHHINMTHATVAASVSVPKLTMHLPGYVQVFVFSCNAFAHNIIVKRQRNTRDKSCNETLMGRNGSESQTACLSVCTANTGACTLFFNHQQQQWSPDGSRPKYGK